MSKIMGKQADVALMALWTALVAVGFGLNPFLGLGLATAVLTAYSWLHYEAVAHSRAETQLARVELALQAKLDSHGERLEALVEQFTQIRADDAMRRGQAAATPRLRG